MSKGKKLGGSRTPSNDSSSAGIMSLLTHTNPEKICDQDPPARRIDQ